MFQLFEMRHDFFHRNRVRAGYEFSERSALCFELFGQQSLHGPELNLMLRHPRQIVLLKRVIVEIVKLVGLQIVGTPLQVVRRVFWIRPGRQANLAVSSKKRFQFDRGGRRYN